MYPTHEKSGQSGNQAHRDPRVLVVGAGALGCAAAGTLAADGGIAITLVDDDRVELSNLQRQVLYTNDDVGRRKVDAAAERLAAETGLAVRTAAIRFDAASGPELLRDADLVIDATDDPATKFLLGRLAADAGVPSVYGGVARTGGQWMLVVPGRSACLECVFPATTSAALESAAGCSALGILAPVAGLVGAMQAITALSFLGRDAVAVPGRLHTYELTGARSRHIDVPRDPGCDACRMARPHEHREDFSGAQANATSGAQANATSGAQANATSGTKATAASGAKATAASGAKATAAWSGALPTTIATRSAGALDQESTS